MKIKGALLIIITAAAISIAAPAEGFRWPFGEEFPKQKEYKLSTSTYFPMTLMFVDKYYVEPERIDPKEMLKGALDDVQRAIPEILVTFASGAMFTMTIDNASKKFSSPLNKLGDLKDVMQEVFAFIELHYKGEVKLDELESIAINGALKMLDPHSAFLTPEFYKEFQIDTGGEFGGLGIVITSKDGQLTVIAPIEDTPAWNAGIKPGDVITQIGNESTVNMSIMEAVERLRGKVGSAVTVTIERKGKTAPFDVSLTRANIHIDSIKASLIRDGDGSVAYIKVKRFQQDTAKDFVKQLKALQKEAGASLKGLIIDLRNNPGGLLNGAVKVADAFLSEGVIVSTVGAHKRFIEEDEAHENDADPFPHPVVVLVNEGSASASEIVAGALQASKRALVIGNKTFGKGSVQSVYDLGDNYALKLTVAQYLTAGKHSIQAEGVTPDIEVNPVTIDRKNMDMIPDKRSSEKELEKSLKQLAPAAAPAKKTMGYYKPHVDEEKEIEELRQKEYESTIDFKDDFAVKLASRVILGSDSPNPEEFLKDSAGITGQLEKQEDEKISARLHELGTDWGGKPQAQASISVSSLTRQNGKIVERAAAGEELQLVLSVTNTGKAAIHKLIGVVESENGFVGEKEFAFGKIAHGETVSREATVKLPLSMTNINIPYKVAFRAGDAPIDAKFSSDLKVAGVVHPSFAINYQLEKPETVGAPHPLPRGKSVPITVKIKNIGNGATKEAHAYLINKKNEKGVFIERGRADLGVIKPSETKTAGFVFRVQPDMKASTFVLELTVSDREHFEFLNEDLEMTVESGAIKPQPGVWYEGPKIELLDKIFPIISKADRYTIKGLITDDSAVKDYYIFSNEEKAAYSSNPHETNTMEINAAIKLKDGNNSVIIIARDNNNLSTKKSFVIQKGSFK